MRSPGPPGVVLSAAAGRAASRIFRSARGLEAITTEANYLEIEEYLPRLAEQYGLEMSDIAANLEALPLDIYPEIRYRSHLGQAAEYLKARDPDDVALAALALKLQIPIWSNDKDFNEVPLIVYPTAKLLKILGL